MAETPDASDMRIVQKTMPNLSVNVVCLVKRSYLLIIQQCILYLKKAYNSFSAQVTNRNTIGHLNNMIYY